MPQSRAVPSVALAALLSACASVPPPVTSAPTLTGTTVPSAKGAPRAPSLFVGESDTVCALLGGSLTCSTGLVLPPKAVGIATSMMHYCAWTSDGETYCAGYNKDGRVGTGARSEHEELTRVSGLPSVAHVAAAARSTCAVTTDGAVWCWGDDVSLAPRQLAGIDHVAAISAGAEPYCLLRDDGTVARVGSSAAPATPFAPLPSLAGLAGCWPISVCGARKDGTAACASTGEFKREFPITTTDVRSLHGVVQVASTAETGCALLGDSTVRCWGGSSASSAAQSPFAIEGFTGVSEIAAGLRRVCALRQDDTVWCIDDKTVGRAVRVLPAAAP
jgi:alpha-tubulin suppressor-like RCC1 family protein